MRADEAAVAAFVDAVVSRPERAAVLTDFDGTLAPIVDDPAGASALRKTRTRVGEIRERLDCGNPSQGIVVHRSHPVLVALETI